MITLRTPEQIALMRRAGRINAQAQAIAAALIRPGCTTAEINEAVAAFLQSEGATPVLPVTAYVSLNDELMGGLPGPRRLQEGDLVTVDIACRKNGWCADSAATHPVGQVSPEADRLLAVGRAALERIIERLSRVTRWSDLAAEIEQFVRDHGFALAEHLGGHGIGRELHEDPRVPNRPADLESDFELRPGVVLAIEPTVVAGNGRVYQVPDTPTWRTADGSLSVHFEHTVALTDSECLTLTAP